MDRFVLPLFGCVNSGTVNANTRFIVAREYKVANPGTRDSPKFISQATVAIPRAPAMKQTLVADLASIVDRINQDTTSVKP